MTHEPGQLLVNVVRVYDTTNFPAPNTVDTAECVGMTTVAELAVTLLRCAPTASRAERLPAIDDLGKAATILHTDMLVLKRAVRCCVPDFPGARKKLRVVTTSHNVRGPEGGCVGSELRLLVDLRDPCGCTETS